MSRQLNSISFILIAPLIAAVLFSCSHADKSQTDTLNNERFNYLIEQSKSYDNAYSYDTALLYSDSAYDYARIRKVEKQMAVSLLRSGAVFQNCYKLDSSKAYLLKAIEISKIANDSLRLALSLNTLGNTVKKMGKYDEALEYYLRAERIYGQMGDSRRQAYVMLNIGNIYYRIEDYEKALALYKKCKAVSLKADNREMVRISAFNIANIYFQLDRFEEAEIAYLEVIELDKEAHNYTSLALGYTNISCVYEDIDNQELRFKYIILALNLAKEIKNKRIEILSTNLLGNYYFDHSKTAEAEVAYKESISLANEIGSINDLKISYASLALLKEKTNDYKQAFSYFKQSSKLSDSLINEKKLKIIYDLESKYKKKKDEAEILRLSNKNATQEIRNKDLKIQLVTVVGVVVLLIGILFFIRLKTKKDRIIADQRIQQLEEEQKLLAAQSVIVGQENERKRIAQELHDSIGVLLSTASIHFSNVADNTDEKTAQLLGKANKLLKQAGGEVRKISHEMMPGVLSKLGLQEALEDLFENVEDTGSLNVECKINVGEHRLKENTEIILYRIIQEILNNTLKHARASSVSFSMEQVAGTLVINYKDDGIGFEQNKIASGQSLGLSGIKSRIDFLHGALQLISGSGKGVEYKITIPA